ncbi:MAG: hypothetical protein JSW34_13710 [Candidatus Zixiibacteriota bacterium]|nr:MAG: hypothetical protein JSW34_13710 [candidate division Zixibacteria bacterium]
MPAYAKLRSDLISVPAEIEGKTVHNIKDPITGNYFRVREPEFWLISQLDGETSYEEITLRFREKFGLEITPDHVRQFVDVLESKFFLENQRSEQATSRKSITGGEKESLFSRLLTIKLKAINPSRMLDFLHVLYRPFHRPFWMVVQVAVILFGVGLLLANSSYFAVRFYEIFNLGSIVSIVLGFFVIIVLHEFAHGLICRYYGGEVREVGFLLLYFQPCFYCDVSDAWLFPEKRHRLAVTLAGPYFSFLLMAVAVIVWRVTVPESFISELARIIVIVIWVTQVFNFNPLIKLDGYYLLSDLLEIPNLRRKSFDYFANAFKRRVLSWPIERIAVTRRERRIYLIYAVAALLYSVFLITYLVWLLGSFLHDRLGVLGLILLFGVLFFSLRSNFVALCRGIVQHAKHMKQILKSPVRLVTYIILVVAFVLIVFVIRFPHRVTGEVTVQPIAEFSLLINDFGLLEKKLRRGGEDALSQSSYLQMTSTDMASLDLVPLVRDGQIVGTGDTLAVLISNQVSTELQAARSELDRLQRDLALLKSPPKPEEVDEAEAEVTAARAVYNQKTRDEERIRELADKNLATAEELEAAQSAAAVAKAALENKRAKVRLLKSPPKPEEEAVIKSEIEKQKSEIDFLQTQLDNQSILSPLSGVVVINQNNSCFLCVVENHQVELLVPVSDFNINLVKQDQSVKLKVRSFTNRVFQGHVAHVPKDAVATDRGARFHVSTIVNNDNNLLHKGMTGYAKIEVGRKSLFSLILRKLASTIRVEFWSWW